MCLNFWCPEVYFISPIRHPYFILQGLLELQATLSADPVLNELLTFSHRSGWVNLVARLVIHWST